MAAVKSNAKKGAPLRKVVDMVNQFQRRLVLVTLLTTLYYSPTLLAAPVLHLLFHMGMGVDGHFFVGGTLENRGDEDIYQGFVVVTPLDQACYPQPPLLHSFTVLKAGEKREFRVPIDGRLEGYKLDTVQGVDHFGNKVAVIDETAEILGNKLPAYLARCQERRNNKAAGIARQPMPPID